MHGVFERDRGVARHQCQQRYVKLAEGITTLRVEVEDAERLVSIRKRHGDEGAQPVTGSHLTPGRETWVGGDVGDDLRRGRCQCAGGWAFTIYWVLQVDLYGMCVSLQ